MGLLIVIIILVGGIRMKNLTYEKIILYGAFAYMFFYILCMATSLN